jgi:hypothetical protein
VKFLNKIQYEEGVERDEMEKKGEILLVEGEESQD